MVKGERQLSKVLIRVQEVHPASAEKDGLINVVLVFSIIAVLEDRAVC